MKVHSDYGTGGVTTTRAGGIPRCPSLPSIPEASSISTPLMLVETRPRKPLVSRIALVSHTNPSVLVLTASIQVRVSIWTIGLSCAVILMASLGKLAAGGTLKDPDFAKSSAALGGDGSHGNYSAYIFDDVET